MKTLTRPLPVACALIIMMGGMVAARATMRLEPMAAHLDERSAGADAEDASLSSPTPQGAGSADAAAPDSRGKGVAVTDARQGGMTIGIVSFFDVTKQFAERKEQWKEVEQLQEQLKQVHTEYREAYKAWEAQYGDLKPTDPDWGPRNREAEQLGKIRSERTKPLHDRQQQAMREAFVAARADVQAAIEVVAVRKGLQYVLQSAEWVDNEALRSNEALLMNTLRRSVLFHPPKADITAEVLEELGIRSE
jgi:Skp family chaperone for outer membrane proteins